MEQILLNYMYYIILEGMYFEKNSTYNMYDVGLKKLNFLHSEMKILMSKKSCFFKKKIIK